RPRGAHPLVARVLVESLRFLRRGDHAVKLFSEEVSEQETFFLQILRISSLGELLTDYLGKNIPPMCLAVSTPTGKPHPDLLLALLDLRAETAKALLPLVMRPKFQHLELALEVLAWSRDPQVAPTLRDWVTRRLNLARRALHRRRQTPPRRRSVPPD